MWCKRFQDSGSTSSTCSQPDEVYPLIDDLIKLNSQIMECDRLIEQLYDSTVSCLELTVLNSDAKKRIYCCARELMCARAMTFAMYETIWNKMPSHLVPYAPQEPPISTHDHLIPFFKNLLVDANLNPN